MTDDTPERIMVSACGKAIVTGQIAFDDDVEYIRADLLEAKLREARVEGMGEMLAHYLNGTWYRSPGAMRSMSALINAERGEGE